eukprot:10125268-Karenia_brevis.AAC.1
MSQQLAVKQDKYTVPELPSSSSVQMNDIMKIMQSLKIGKRSGQTDEEVDDDDVENSSQDLGSEIDGEGDQDSCDDSSDDGYACTGGGLDQLMGHALAPVPKAKAKNKAKCSRPATHSGQPGNHLLQGVEGSTGTDNIRWEKQGAKGKGKGKRAKVMDLTCRTTQHIDAAKAETTALVEAAYGELKFDETLDPAKPAECKQLKTAMGAR